MHTHDAKRQRFSVKQASHRHEIQQPNNISDEDDDGSYSASDRNVNPYRVLPKVKLISHETYKSSSYKKNLYSIKDDHVLRFGAWKSGGRDTVPAGVRCDIIPSSPAT